MLISLNVPGGGGPICPRPVGAPGLGRRGRGAASGPGPLPPGVLKGAVFYFALFPGIMALDINGSHQQLAVINAEPTAGAGKRLGAVGDRGGAQRREQLRL